MARLCLSAVLVAVCFAFGHAGYVQFHSSLNPTGSENLTLAMTKAEGLTMEQKQFLLDYHNELRARLANGQATGYMGERFPTASNMLALEWDDKLAAFADVQTQGCVREHLRLGHLQYPYVLGATTENLQGRIEHLELSMYAEIKFRNFKDGYCHGRCGHFTAGFQWSVARVGCSYKYCPSSNEDYEVIACEYAGRWAMSGQNHWRYEDYKAGPQCSDCPKGYDYCMDGALCASRAMCESSDRSSCQCAVNEGVCSQNGQYDGSLCRCTCNPGYMGANCDQKCEDLDTDTCFEIVRPQGCSVNKLRDAFMCPVTCNKCSSAYSTSSIYDIFTSELPKDNSLSVNTKTKAVQYSANDVYSLPNAGQCQNKESDDYCEYGRNAGYCQDVVIGKDFRCNCKLSCDNCGQDCTAATIDAGFAVDPADIVWGAEEELSDEDMMDFWKRKRRGVQRKRRNAD